MISVLGLDQDLHMCIPYVLNWLPWIQNRIGNTDSGSKSVPYWEYGFRIQIWIQTVIITFKKEKIWDFRLKRELPGLLKAWGFQLSLEVLYQFLAIRDKKNEFRRKFFRTKFFFQFGHEKPRYKSGYKKPDPYWHGRSETLEKITQIRARVRKYVLDPDPKHWVYLIIPETSLGKKLAYLPTAWTLLCESTARVWCWPMLILVHPFWEHAPDLKIENNNNGALATLRRRGEQETRVPPFDHLPWVTTWLLSALMTNLNFVFFLMDVKQICQVWDKMRQNSILWPRFLFSHKIMSILYFLRFSANCKPIEELCYVCIEHFLSFLDSLGG
jgi:hypothetical protein